MTRLADKFKHSGLAGTPKGTTPNKSPSRGAREGQKQQLSSTGGDLPASMQRSASTSGRNASTPDRMRGRNDSLNRSPGSGTLQRGGSPLRATGSDSDSEEDYGDSDSEMDWQ